MFREIRMWTYKKTLIDIMCGHTLLAVFLRLVTLEELMRRLPMDELIFMLPPRLRMINATLLVYEKYTTKLWC